MLCGDEFNGLGPSLMGLTHGNVIFDILEPPAFQKYSICWVFQAFFCSTFFYMYFATRPRPSKVYQNPSISWTKKIKVISCDWTRALSVPDQGKLGRSSWIQNWSRPSPRSDCVPAENFNRWSFENKYF